MGTSENWTRVQMKKWSQNGDLLESPGTVSEIRGAPQCLGVTKNNADRFFAICDLRCDVRKIPDILLFFFCPSRGTPGRGEKDPTPTSIGNTPRRGGNPLHLRSRRRGPAGQCDDRGWEGVRCRGEGGG